MVCISSRRSRVVAVGAYSTLDVELKSEAPRLQLTCRAIVKSARGTKTQPTPLHHRLPVPPPVSVQVADPFQPLGPTLLP